MYKRQVLGAANAAGTADSGAQPNPDGSGLLAGSNTSDESATDSTLRRFYGTVKLDAGRVGRDAGRIATEVLSHLTGLQGADAEVSLDITINVNDGIPENIVRTVSENCRTLKFDEHGFENE